MKRDYSEYLLRKRGFYKAVRVKKIYLPYGTWFNKNFKFSGKKILDLGCLIESTIYQKFLKENGSSKNYYGFDIDQDSVNWAKKIGAYYDIYQGNDANIFDYIFLIDVYEHLEPDERMRILNISQRLLKKGGILCVSYPYTKNLNFFHNFLGDWTHKIVDLEAEVAAFVVFGNFKFEAVRCYLGGWTMPFLPFKKNILSILRNLICLYPPFHVSTILAQKTEE